MFFNANNSRTKLTPPAQLCCFVQNKEKMIQNWAAIEVGAKHPSVLPIAEPVWATAGRFPAVCNVQNHNLKLEKIPILSKCHSTTFCLFCLFSCPQMNLMPTSSCLSWTLLWFCPLERRSKKWQIPDFWAQRRRSPVRFSVKTPWSRWELVRSLVVNCVAFVEFLEIALIIPSVAHFALFVSLLFC